MCSGSDGIHAESAVCRVDLFQPGGCDFLLDALGSLGLVPSTGEISSLYGAGWTFYFFGTAWRHASAGRFCGDCFGVSLDGMAP